MRSRRMTILLTLLLIGLLAMSACAPRPTGGEVAGDDADIAIDLPALVLDIQEDGSLSTGGISFAELGGMIGQPDLLAAASIPPDIVKTLVDSNIQHIQLDNTAEGLLILVNGKPVPSLAWDGESLVTTAKVIEDFGAAPIVLLDKLLPLLTHMGIGVTIRVPVTADAELLPLGAIDAEAAAQTAAATKEYLDSVVVPPTISLAIEYAEDGSMSAAGMSLEELGSLIPGLDTSPNPNTVAQMDALGIDQLGFSTAEAGFFITINGKQLPYLTWEDGRISNVLELAIASGVLDELLPMPAEEIMSMADIILPMVLATNASVDITFP